MKTQNSIFLIVILYFVACGSHASSPDSLRHLIEVNMISRNLFEDNFIKAKADIRDVYTVGQLMQIYMDSLVTLIQEPKIESVNYNFYRATRNKLVAVTAISFVVWMVGANAEKHPEGSNELASPHRQDRF